MTNKQNHLGSFFLVAAVYPFLLDWQWGRGMLLLWGLLGWMEWKNRGAAYPSCSVLLRFVTYASSFWAVMTYGLGHPPSWLVVGVWIFLFILTIYNFARPTPPFFTIVKTFGVHTVYPSKALSLSALIATIGGWMIVHGVLNTLFGKPFDLGGWAPMTWGVLGFSIFYPEAIAAAPPRPANRYLKVLYPLLIAILLLGHSIRYITFTWNAQTDRVSSSTVERIFSSGYTGLGIRAAISLTERIDREQGWSEGVRYLRSQWRYAYSRHFAKEWLKRHDEQPNLFLFACSFGCTLELKPDEKAVDFTVAPLGESMHIVTSHQRLIRLDRNGLTVLPSIPDVPDAIVSNATGKRILILTASHRVLSFEDGTYRTILQLPDSRTWENQRWDDLDWIDIALSDNGQIVWALDDRGTIETYSLQEDMYLPLPDEDGFYPPLWSQSHMAQSLITTQAGTCIMLDRFGGVHWRDADQPPPNHFTPDNLSKYYHPEKSVMRDIAFWRNENELVLMNAFGRLDFVTSKNIPPPTDDGSTPLHDWDADPISSVRPQFEFDRKRAVRRSPAKAVAVASLPQIDTILELFENGVVNTIVMPHGARIEFKEDEALISTY